ncbi:MAG TPA: formylglycine-generating enzyme family protein [Chitinophagales bacterium]|nr:formylglycine-generating enzyme family protein [Chitinophagales bacterium]HRK26312.1 formylglycine-generating enzyme family protein [Chitinophagales bacterium]
MPTNHPNPTQAHTHLQTGNLLLPKNYFVQVQGGSFNMGSDKEAGEKRHKVTVPTFYIARYPVTQALWEAVMGNNPSYFKGSEHPVENVSWRDAQAFCEKLSKTTGYRYRLPTEAEWEFAARGGINSQNYTYAGSNNLHEVGWYGENSHQQTKPVGLKKPNELGIYDMSGNVWEWCSSLYRRYPYKADDGREDLTDTGNRVCRGGSWDDDARYCRLAYRVILPDFGNGRIGFRLAVAPV